MRKAGYAGPIVLVTGDTLRPAQQQALIAMGFTAVLTKMAKPGARQVLARLAQLKVQFKKKGGGTPAVIALPDQQGMRQLPV